MIMHLERTVELSGFASPLIVLHFPGFRLSLSDKHQALLWAIAGRVARAVVVGAATYGVYCAGSRLLAFWSALLVQAAVYALITFSTFLSCTMMTMDVKPVDHPLPYELPVHASSSRKQRRRSRLPTLTPSDVEVCKRQRMGYAFPDGVENQALSKERRQRPQSLPLIGRRVAEQLKETAVHVEGGERRRRSQASLADASIRVGKAHTRLMPGAHKPQDIYIVRVDCADKKAEKKRPVVWDLTATFQEFQKLERELKKEVKAKKLSGKAGKVPHLSSGSVLFVQRELDDHVLNARRLKLQQFVDSVRGNKALAATDALRKFCQAY